MTKKSLHKKKNNSKNVHKEFTPLERYKTLIAARNFHYDNFNKWLSYFYIAIGTLFIGFCTLKTSDKSSSFELEIIMILILGYIISLLWFLSCKGYYYWNINFIMLVNDCEKKCLKLKKEERVYSVFANKETENKYFSPINGANISTSKVAILFSFIITISWGILLLKEFMKFIDDRCLSIVLHILGVILIPIITLSFSYISQLFLQSKIDHFPDLKLDQTERD